MVFIPQLLVPGRCPIKLFVKGGCRFSEDPSKHNGAVSSVEEVAVEGFCDRDEVFYFAVLDPISLEVAKDQAL